MSVGSMLLLDTNSMLSLMIWFVACSRFTTESRLFVMGALIKLMVVSLFLQSTSCIDGSSAKIHLLSLDFIPYFS